MLIVWISRLEGLEWAERRVLRGFEGFGEPSGFVTAGGAKQGRCAKVAKRFDGVRGNMVGS